MPRSLPCVVLVACLLLGSVLTTAAQDDFDDDEVDDIGDYLPDSPPQVPTKRERADIPMGGTGLTIFPEFAEARFPAGATVEALVGFSNIGTQPFRVEYIRGMLRMLNPPYSFVQNFSGALYNSTVSPGDDACLLYRFAADLSVAVQDYELLLELFYTTATNETHLAVVHNSTVFIDEAPTVVGFQLVFAYLTIAGLLGAAGYGVHLYVQRNTRKPSGRARKEEARESTGKTGETAAAPQGAIDWDYVSVGHRKLVQPVVTVPAAAPAAAHKESPSPAARKETPPPAAAAKDAPTSAAAKEAPTPAQRKESPNRKTRSSPSRKAE